jgi:hypothetical protein
VANAGYQLAEQCHRQEIGFQVIGTLLGSFRHKQLGYVDALVMIQGLVEGPAP